MNAFSPIPLDALLARLGYNGRYFEAIDRWYRWHRLPAVNIRNANNRMPVLGFWVRLKLALWAFFIRQPGLDWLEDVSALSVNATRANIDRLCRALTRFKSQYPTLSKFCLKIIALLRFIEKRAIRLRWFCFVVGDMRFTYWNETFRLYWAARLYPKFFEDLQDANNNRNDSSNRDKAFKHSLSFSSTETTA